MKGQITNEKLIEEIVILNKLNTIWPDMFENLVLNN